MKVAICGAGDMGEVHFDAFSAVEGVEIVSVADPDAARLERFAQRGAALYSSSEEMLDKVEADVASIAAPTAFHAPLSIQALERGMHVFCEKPMARTSADGEKMAAAAAKAGRTLAIGYSLRFNSAWLLAREYIQEGRLGRIGTVRTSRCAGPEGAWRGDIAANGGAAFELLTHDLDWLAWTLGPVKRVFARGLAGESASVERDYVLAVLRFENGAIAHLEGSLAEAGEFYATYEIAGEAGLLSYDTRKSNTIETRLSTSDGLLATKGTPSNERPFPKQIAEFVSAIRDDRPYAVSPEEALVALGLAEKVLASVETGKPVDL